MARKTDPLDPLLPSAAPDRPTEVVPLEALHADPANARRHPERNLQAIRDSLREFGQVEPLIVQEKTGRVIGGNGRLSVMRDLGWKSATVVRLPLSATQATALAIALNRTGELAEWDNQALELQLKGLAADEFDLSSLHFDDLAFSTSADNSEIDHPNGTDLAGDDEPTTPDVPDAPDVYVKLGDIYTLGKHRLLCGDSTDAAAVSCLTQGEKIDLIFTDPPYGMNLNTDFDSMFKSDKAHRKTGHRHVSVVGDDRSYDPSHIFEQFGHVAEILLWGADYYRKHLPDGGSWFCWDKRCDENMDKVVGNTFELAWSKKPHKREVARILWSGHHGMQNEDARKRLHPTQKPTRLVRWFFERFDANVVLDLFAGSGSTLIGCEQMGRSCLAAEISPAYCQVILERWQALTGKKAVRHPAK